MDWCERIADAGYKGLNIPITKFPNREALERLIAPHRAKNPDFEPTDILIRLDWLPHVIVPELGAVPLNPLPSTYFGRKRPAVRRALSLKSTWPILRVTGPGRGKAGHSLGKAAGRSRHRTGWPAGGYRCRHRYKNSPSARGPSSMEGKGG
ncbi:MAG: hypothetical protein QM758_04750 [Armatimonas sp.]